MINSILQSFNTGELSPRLWSRVDLDKYNSGCRRLENFIVMPYGGINRRPGTEFISEVKDSTKAVRLIGFNFSITTNFVLEFGNQYVRFYSNGAQVQVASVPYEIASPYLAADLFQLQYCQINDVMYIAHANYPVYKLSRLADTNWTLSIVSWDYPAFRDENVTNTTVTPSATTGTGITIAASSAIFDPGDVGGYYRIGNERSSTTSKIALTANGSGSNISVLGTWEFTTTGVWKGTVAVQASYDKGTTWETVRSFDGDSDRNITTTGVQEKEALMRVTMTNHSSSTAPTYAYLDAVEATVYGVVKVTAVPSVRTVNITGIASFTGSFCNINATAHGLQPGQVISISGVTTPIALNGTQYVASVVDSSHFVVNVTYASYTGSGVISTVANTVATADSVKDLYAAGAGTPTTQWAEGEWSTRRGFPRSVVLHQQRLFFGGNSAHAVTVWGSVIGDFENFLITTFDDSGLNLTLSTVEQNVINWLISFKQNLVIGTSGDEYILAPSGSSSALTPTNLDARRQSRYGSAYLPAVLVNNAVLYVQRHGRKMQEMVYNWQIDGFISQDLTLLSDHITAGGIVQHAYQQQFDSILWCITGNGVLIGMTYDRNQNVVGWHRHTTQGTFESVATIYGANTGDEVWVIANRFINGQTKRFVERFDPDYRDTIDLNNKTAWLYVDSTTTNAASVDGLTWTGLDHLEGQTVSILADGAVHPSLVVTGGSVTLQISASVVQIGLQYASYIKPTSVSIGQMQGGTDQGRHYRMHRADLRLYNSLGGEFESAPGVFDPIVFRDHNSVMDQSPNVFSGEVELTLSGNFGRTADVNIRQLQPLPMTILAILPKFDVLGD